MAAPTPYHPCSHAGTQSGRSPNPLFIERRNILGRSQTETITIRVTPEEKLTMQGKMCEAVAPSMRDFILKMSMNGKVIVNSNLWELNKELRYQGNNLNQLTKLAHQSRISSIDLLELLSLYRQILLALGGASDGNCWKHSRKESNTERTERRAELLYAAIKNAKTGPLV